MPKSIKTILYILGGLLGLFALVAMALLLFVDADIYKPRLEAAASHALGMEVTVEGRLGVSFFPGVLVTLKKVSIRNRGTEIASAAEAKLGLELLPLLRKQLRMGTISLQHPRISIERDRDGAGAGRGHGDEREPGRPPGGLDFVHERFSKMTVALIDAEGCAKVRQSIRDGFQNPVAEQPNVLKSLAGPLQKLFQMGRDLFPGGECEVFYTGSVAPPK